MHVGVFAHNYPPHPGGLEVMVREVAHGLARRGHRVTLLTSAWKGVRGMVDEEGVRVHRVPVLHASESWGVPYPVPTGAGLAAAWRQLSAADLLWAHGALYATSLLAAWMSRRRRVPLVLTEHVGWVPYRSRGVEAVERLAWATAGRAVLAQAEAATTYNLRVVEWLGRRRPSLAVRFIGNGVDVERFRPPQDGERARRRRGLELPEVATLVLFAGRDSAKKNLEAVLTLPREGFRLVVCGAERRLPDDVVNLGWVSYDRMPDLYASVDAMIHASVGEGFPLAVQEALAAGLPLALLWDQGYARWLDRSVVAACDRLQDLGPAVTRLVSDPASRAELGRRGRRWAVERWSWRKTVDEYEQLFTELLQAARAPREAAR